MTEKVKEKGGELVLHQGIKDMILDLHQTVTDAVMEKNTEDFVLSLMDEILSATTVDEIFEASESGEGISGKDFVDRPFYLQARDLTWGKSRDDWVKRNQALPFFAWLSVEEIATGNRYSVNTGGRTAVAVLYKLWKIGALDGDGGMSLVFSLKETEAGYHALIVKPYNLV